MIFWFGLRFIVPVQTNNGSIMLGQEPLLPVLWGTSMSCSRISHNGGGVITKEISFQRQCTTAANMLKFFIMKKFSVKNHPFHQMPTLHELCHEK